MKWASVRNATDLFSVRQNIFLLKVTSFAKCFFLYVGIFENITMRIWTTQPAE